MERIFGRRRQKKLVLAQLLLVVGVAFLHTTATHALPSLRDYWHLNCAPTGVTKKLLESSQAKMGESPGADLDAACVQSALEVQQFKKRLENWQAGGAKGKAPVIDQRKSLEMIKTAQAKLEASYKTKKSPQVGFPLGMALALQADDWSVNRMDEVQRGAPASPLAAEAYLILGEIQFEKQDFDKATEYYRKAIPDAGTLTKEYVGYKLAWIDYVRGARSKNVAVQRKALERIAQQSKRLSTSGGVIKALGLKAKEDSMSMIVDMGDMAAAKQILQNVGAMDLYGTLLERMAYTRLNEGNAKAAYDLFAQAIKENPTSLQAPEYALNQLQIAAQMRNVGAVSSNLKGLVRNYILPKAPWRKKQKPEDVTKIEQKIETAFLDFTTAIDRQGRDTKSLSDLKTAEQLYTIFLKYFPRSKKYYDMQYFYGALLFAMEKHELAAKTLAAMIKGFPKGKYTKESLEVMVSAAQTAFDADKTAYQLPQPGKGLEELKIPSVKQVYADSLDLFVKLLPDHQSVPDMQYAAASVYYDFAHYEEGVRRYRLFVKKYPANPNYTVPAVARILEYYKHNEKGAALAKVKAELLEIPDIAANPQLKPALAANKSEKSEKSNGGEKTKDLKTVKDTSNDEAVEEEEAQEVPEGE